MTIREIYYCLVYNNISNTTNLYFGKKDDSKNNLSFEFTNIPISKPISNWWITNIAIDKLNNILLSSGNNKIIFGAKENNIQYKFTIGPIYNWAITSVNFFDNDNIVFSVFNNGIIFGFLNGAFSNYVYRTYSLIAYPSNYNDITINSDEEIACTSSQIGIFFGIKSGIENTAISTNTIIIIVASIVGGTIVLVSAIFFYRKKKFKTI